MPSNDKERLSADHFLYEVNSSSEDGLLDNETSRRRSKWIPLAVRTPWSIHIALLSLYTFIYILIVGTMSHRVWHGPNLIYSPAREAVHYETVTFDGSFVIESPFTGEPRPELDNAWHELLRNANIRVSADTLNRINHTSIPFSDGDGYYTQLGMFHELHCLKRIRQFIHSGYYFPQQSEEAREINALHTDHCLEILRQGAMCRGDISLVTFVWNDAGKVPLADFTRPHECVNFDSLQEWSGEHAVNAFEPGLLHHPTLGDSFPGGEVSIIA